MGQPDFAAAIVLDAADSVLQLGITTELNQSVTGSGKVSLVRDLVVGKNVQLPSLVDQNGRNLTLTGGTITATVTNQTGGAISILSNTSMTALWTIGTGADVYNIDGNGHVLSLSSSGGITFNGTSLYLSNMHIKGLADANPINGTGTIYLSNVTIELAADFTRADGDFVVWGEDCKVITNGNTFTMSGAGNDLLVNGVILYFEQLDQSGLSPFAVAASGTITESNGGKIANALGTNQPIGITTTTFDLKHNHFLTEASAISFSGQSAIAFDAAGLFVHFPYQAASALFTVAASLDLAVTNVVLKDFNPDAVSIGASGSITYGDGVRMELGQDILIDALADSWVFDGDAEIDGNGANLTITKSDGITITGVKTLTLKNMTLTLGVADGIRALADDSIIELDNVTVVIRENGFDLSGGSLYIRNFVKMTGGIGGVLGRTDFSITTKNFLYIQDRSELWLDPNINLLYDADPTLDTTLADTKNHVQFEQVQSVLTLNGCSVTSTATGILLDVGTLHIIDKVDLNPTTDAAAEFEFGQQLQVNMSAGAVIDLTGPAKYFEIPPPDPLRYGDIIIISHKTYGFKIWDINSGGAPAFHAGTGSQQGHSQAVGSSTDLQGMASFWTYPVGQQPIISIQPGDDEKFFTSPKLLQSVKSGDMVKLQYHAGESIGAGVNQGYLLVGYTSPFSGAFYPPPNSSPIPPYCAVGWGNNPADPTSKMGMRLFKHGAAIGDTVLEGDDVYFQSFYRTNELSPSFIYRPIYLGSANLQITGDTGNTAAILAAHYVSELFWYLGSTAVEVPPNFASDYIWNVSIHDPGGYASYNIPLDTTTNTNTTYDGGYFSGWPAASGYQF